MLSDNFSLKGVVQGFLALNIFCFLLLPNSGQASSQDAWEEFRLDVKRSCLKQSAGFNIGKIFVDDFGTESYGFAVISGTPNNNNKISQLRACVYDKKSRKAEIILIGDGEAINTQIWEEFRLDVKRSCLKQSAGFNIGKIFVDDFGTESYGFAVISGTPNNNNKISQLRACVYDKKSRKAEIILIEDGEAINTLMNGNQLLAKQFTDPSIAKSPASWIHKPEPDWRIAPKEKRNGFEVLPNGSARFLSNQLFPPTSNPYSTRLFIYVSPNKQLAVAVQQDLDWGGLRVAAVDLSQGGRVTNQVIPESNVRGLAAPKQVIRALKGVSWSPDSSNASMAISSAEWQADLAVITMKTPSIRLLKPTNLAKERWAFPKLETVKSTANSNIEVMFDLLACADKNCESPRVVGSIPLKQYVGVALNEASKSPSTHLTNTVLNINSQPGKWTNKIIEISSPAIENVWGLSIKTEEEKTVYYQSPSGTSNYKPIDSMEVNVNGQRLTLYAYPNVNLTGAYDINGVFQCTSLVSQYLTLLRFETAPYSLPHGRDVVNKLTANGKYKDDQSSNKYKEYFSIADNKSPPLPGSIISMEFGTGGNNAVEGHVAIVKGTTQIDENTIKVNLIEQNIPGFPVNREITFIRDRANGSWSAKHSISETGSNKYSVINWTTPLKPAE